MRLALLTYSYSAGGLGTISHLVPLVRELRRIGAEVDVFSCLIHPPIFGEPTFMLSCSLKKLDNYDVIHSHESAGLFVRHNKIVEIYYHDSRFTHNFWDSCFNAIERRALEKSNHIVTPSFLTKKCLTQQGFLGKKITVIHHGVDHNVFKPNRKARTLLRKKYGLKGFVAITVGSMIKRKSARNSKAYVASSFTLSSW